MMRDRDGNLRGFCYIDFANEAGALAGPSLSLALLRSLSLCLQVAMLKHYVSVCHTHTHRCVCVCVCVCVVCVCVCVY